MTGLTAQINTIYIISVALLVFAILFFLLFAFLFIKTFFVDHFSFSFLGGKKKANKKDTKEEKMQRLKKNKESEIWDETVPLDSNKEKTDIEYDWETQVLADGLDEEETALLKGQRKAEGFEVKENVIITH